MQLYILNRCFYNGLHIDANNVLQMQYTESTWKTTIILDDLRGMFSDNAIGALCDFEWQRSYKVINHTVSVA